MNVLFLADPNSIHDIKWMSWQSARHTCFLIARTHHLQNWSEDQKEDFYSKYAIKILGAIDDFSIRRLLNTQRQYYKLRAIFKKYDLEVFHILYAEPNALWGVYRWRMPQCKWVLTTRGTDVLKTIPIHFDKKDLLNQVVSKLYYKALRNFNIITCTSISQKRQVEKLTSHQRVEIVRTGVDVSAILKGGNSVLPVELQGYPYLLFPRSMQPLYNHEFSLAAIKLLPERIKSLFKFVFVDRDSNNKAYVKKIEELMKEIGEEKFVFLSKQSQEAIYGLYKQATIIIMNPISDGAPVSAMEALLCGRPLILGNLHYDEDIFGDTCIKLTSWSAEQLTKVIEEVIKDTDKVSSGYGVDRITQRGNRDIEMNKIHLMYLE